MGKYEVRIKGPVRTDLPERIRFMDIVMGIDPRAYGQTMNHRRGMTPSATFIVEADSPKQALDGIFTMLPATVAESLTEFSVKVTDARRHGWIGTGLRKSG